MRVPERDARGGLRPLGGSSSAPWSIGVVVPARDEVASVAACVTSIRAALRATGLPGRIVVVADRCTDETAPIARRALGGDGDVLSSSAGRAGAARRAGADHLLATGRPPRLTWLATTDADTTVPPDWLCTHLAEADGGAAAVAGIVVLAADADHDVAARHAAVYELNPDGSHPHVHGANLGMRGDAYIDAGGWSSSLPVGEDHVIWDRLRARRWPVVATSRSWVTTSGRSLGRVEGGFASDLATLAAGARGSCAPVGLAG